MALNPPIQALPHLETDRDGHLQRFLTSLPTFGSDSWPGQEGAGEGSVQTHDSRGDMEVGHSGRIHDRETEAAERRLQRKTRRRNQAAILKPKPPPPSPPPYRDQDRSSIHPKHELDQEWWDKHRAQKTNTHTNKKQGNRNSSLEREIEKADMIMERKENRQKRIPRAKGKREKGGIPGLEIIDGYRPMTTALGPRITMKPENKKGMFANGKSSDPAVISRLEQTKVNNPRVSSSQSTSNRRLTLESPKDKGDWKDQWRRKSQPSQAQFSSNRMVQNEGLPPPGYTNSTSWPSTVPSSEITSRPSRRGAFNGAGLVDLGGSGSGPDRMDRSKQHPISSHSRQFAQGMYHIQDRAGVMGHATDMDLDHPDAYGYGMQDGYVMEEMEQGPSGLHPQEREREYSHAHQDHHQGRSRDMMARRNHWLAQANRISEERDQIPGMARIYEDQIYDYDQNQSNQVGFENGHGRSLGLYEAEDRDQGQERETRFHQDPRSPYPPPFAIGHLPYQSSPMITTHTDTNRETWIYQGQENQDHQDQQGYVVHQDHQDHHHQNHERMYTTPTLGERFYTHLLPPHDQQRQPGLGLPTQSSRVGVQELSIQDERELEGFWKGNPTNLQTSLPPSSSNHPFSLLRTMDPQSPRHSQRYQQEQDLWTRSILQGEVGRYNQPYPHPHIDLRRQALAHHDPRLYDHLHLNTSLGSVRTTFPPQSYITPRLPHPDVHPYAHADSYMDQSASTPRQPLDGMDGDQYLQDGRRRYDNQVEDVRGGQGDVEEFGASRDEWKNLWSSGKAIR